MEVEVEVEVEAEAEVHMDMTDPNGGLLAEVSEQLWS